MDALSSVSDNIFAIALGVPSNARAGTAPVNAPYLWDMWLFDFVQYNASSSGRSPMNRDIGQVIGQSGILQLLDRDKAAEVAGIPTLEDDDSSDWFVSNSALWMLSSLRLGPSQSSAKSIAPAQRPDECCSRKIALSVMEFS